jgi:hypothetical protein
MLYEMDGIRKTNDAALDRSGKGSDGQACDRLRPDAFFKQSAAHRNA